MAGQGDLLTLATSSLCGFFFLALFKLLHKYWWTPASIQKLMSSQGITGPPYEFIHGNNKENIRMRNEALAKSMPLTHDIFPRLMPSIYSRIKTFGHVYLSWAGAKAQLFVSDPELAREILINRDRVYRKTENTAAVSKIFGDGLVTTEGEKWGKMRKLANHAFHGESLKSMNPAVLASIETMLERWKQHEGKEIEVFEEFRLLTSEVISRTAFGSSYLEGEKIFQMLMKLSVIAFRSSLRLKFPGLHKIWRNADEIEVDKLGKEIHDSVMQIVRVREEKVRTGEADDFGTDFLGLLVKAYHDADDKNRISEQDLVDECKTFYFAGQETTNSLLAWSVLLLAMHTDWQEKARKEVMELFGDRKPNPEGISKLKIMSMIINETLRLYPPIIAQMRKAGREVQLGKFTLPANMEIGVMNLAIHHDPHLWGDDVHQFKPERFAEGIAKATNNNVAAFIPFGMGPRSCVGMNLATTETKAALSMILQRYSFSLSPAYIHAPFVLMMIQPQHGIQIILYPSRKDWKARKYGRVWRAVDPCDELAVWVLLLSSLQGSPQALEDAGSDPETDDFTGPPYKFTMETTKKASE